MIRRILAALDDSPRAPAVFETAVALARLAGANVVVFRALATTAAKVVNLATCDVFVVHRARA